MSFSSCDEAYVFEIDYVPNALIRSSYALVHVTGGKGPYTWSQDDVTVTFQFATTVGEWNILIGNDTLSDSVNITVTDDCGEIRTACVKICDSRTCLIDECALANLPDVLINPQEPDAVVDLILAVDALCTETEFCQDLLTYTITGLGNNIGLLYERKVGAAEWTLVKPVNSTFTWWCKPRACVETEVYVRTIDGLIISNVIELGKYCNTCDSPILTQSRTVVNCMEGTEVDLTNLSCCPIEYDDSLSAIGIVPDTERHKTVIYAPDENESGGCCAGEQTEFAYTCCGSEKTTTMSLSWPEAEDLLSWSIAPPSNALPGSSIYISADHGTPPYQWVFTGGSYDSYVLGFDTKSVTLNITSGNTDPINITVTDTCGAQLTATISFELPESECCTLLAGTITNLPTNIDCGDELDLTLNLTFQDPLTTSCTSDCEIRVEAQYGSTIYTGTHWKYYAPTGNIICCPKPEEFRLDYKTDNNTWVTIGQQAAILGSTSPIAWNGDNPTTIAPGGPDPPGRIALLVENVETPLNWSIIASTSDFTLLYDYTVGPANILYTGPDTCGICTVRVEDGCDNVLTTVITSTNGYWEYLPEDQDCHGCEGYSNMDSYLTGWDMALCGEYMVHDRTEGTFGASGDVGDPNFTGNYCPTIFDAYGWNPNNYPPPVLQQCIFHRPPSECPGGILTWQAVITNLPYCCFTCFLWGTNPLADYYAFSAACESVVERKVYKFECGA